jgi:copper resistance protein D
MSLALILVRWLHLSASMLLAGLFLFQAVIVVPAARKPSADIGHLLGRIHRLTCRAALWMLLLALLSWFAWSCLVASTMTGDNLIECLQTGDWLIVLTGTQFGHLWWFRMMVNLVFGINLWLMASRPEKRSARRSAPAWLSVIGLVSLAWVGHAAAGSGPFAAIHLSGDALHLLASAFWPGALAPLAVFLFLILNSNQVEAIGLAAPVVRRFSASSLIAVAVMALTGLLNGIFMVGSIQALLTSAYGQLLASKIVLFCAMIGFGAWNLLVLKPRITHDPLSLNIGNQSAVRLLLKNILWEIALGTVVILIVGLLGTMPPPMRN